MLHQAGGTGENHIGRGRANDDQVQLRSSDTGSGERFFGRSNGQIAGVFASSGDVPLLNPRTLAYPLVAGLYPLHQLGVGEYVIRQMAAGPDDSGGECMHQIDRARAGDGAT